MNKYNILLAILLAALLITPVKAQSWQCNVPQNMSLARPKIELPPSRNAIRRTSIDGYIMALSWSREYCKNRGKRAENMLQCNSRIGDFGFILHGLWPEAKGPNYPQWCRKAPLLPRAIIRKNICMTPSAQLLQREWAKHGTCMTRRPEAYFDAARLMFNAITFPDMDRLSRQYKRGDAITAAGLGQAFANENEDLPANAIKVKTNRRGWLQEVYLCLGKDFMPRRCPNFVRGERDTNAIKIWRGG